VEAKPINPAHRSFVSYIDKSREFYAAQGFTEPYRWARFDDVPFTRLEKPISEATVTLLTTASLFPAPGETPAPAAVFSMSSEEPPERLYTDNRFWDKDATHTDDVDSFFPARRVRELAARGGFLMAPRLFGVPTEYSQRLTMETDAPALLSLCREDHVDAAILVPL
jgi:D-proline reductase (dithiol) PrdB